MENIILSVLRQNHLLSADFVCAPETALPQLAAFSDFLLRENDRINLTAITAPHDVALKHIADSICISPHIARGAVLLDVGSGAGFPALPIAIVRPDITVYALDSTAKKTDFILRAAAFLELQNVRVITARAEEAARDGAYRETFDVVTARAVSELNILCELCSPFLKQGGRFIAMKADAPAREIADAESALRPLHLEIEKQLPLTLQNEREQINRTLILINKTAPTPNIYPRANAKIKKQPL